LTRKLLIAAVLVTALAASAAAAPPRPPPKVGGAPGDPPPAWIEAGGVQKWLAFSSFCWKTTCADFIAPAMRTDVPSLSVRRGQATTIHFPFLPKRVTVSPVTKNGAGKSVRLAAARTVMWRPKAGGLAVISVDAAPGDASYLVRIKLR
jgi:hypothetical protein